MKVEVLKDFKDKETDEIRKTGEVFECSEGRYAEIMKVNKNLISILNNQEDEDKQEQEAETNENVSSSGNLCDIAQTEENGEGYLDANDLENMNYSNLKKLAKSMGILEKGSKAELIRKIKEERIKYKQ